MPDVILVNGPSSAGKTTLCRALQAAITEPYLCVGFDEFIFPAAPRYYRGADTGGQTRIDEFTAQGVEMWFSPPSGRARPDELSGRCGEARARRTPGLAFALSCSPA